MNFVPFDNDMLYINYVFSFYNNQVSNLKKILNGILEYNMEVRLDIYSYIFLTYAAFDCLYFLL